MPERQRLPVIVSFGGINAAGRASGHGAYLRLVESALDKSRRRRMFASLAPLMGIEPVAGNEHWMLEHTLIRRIEDTHFDVEAVPWNQRLSIGTQGGPIRFTLPRRTLPEPLPEGWVMCSDTGPVVEIEASGEQRLLLPTTRRLEVQAAGQLPTGFDPGRLYNSRNHPRGLQMTVFAASDALGNLGLDWEEVRRRVRVVEISVYAGSAIGQLDPAGTGGMLKSRYIGQRVTSKHCPLGFAEMPADLINAYVLGSMGATGATLGACATFLYNLRNAIADIRSGRSRVAIVGAAEAPVTPEIIEGYAAMGALATDRELRALDGLAGNELPDYRRACRPFGRNCGFTIAESAQAVVLFDDALAVETGASVFGAATDVFVNADGFKKSISGPGVGNYITVAKALAAAGAIVGRDALGAGLVQAHGTGTPQNRVTESRILSETARHFGLQRWPLAALKCYLGHSIGTASGDQVTGTLGIWEHGLIPGITTIDDIAGDVEQGGLDFCRTHREIDPTASEYAVINSKGFGGNNASATLLSPGRTLQMLATRYGAAEMQHWERAHERVQQRREDYEQRMLRGDMDSVYHFDQGVLADNDVTWSAQGLRIGASSIDLALENPFADMSGENGT